MQQSLSEQFARRAREFSDAVARLGQHRRIDPELLRLFEEIRQKRLLCEEAERNLQRYLNVDEEREEDRRGKVSHTGR